MNAATAEKLIPEDGFISATWFDTSDEVFSRMSNMIKCGWRVTAYGLVSDDADEGTVVARPIKIRGNRNYTGLGIWTLNEDL